MSILRRRTLSNSFGPSGRHSFPTRKAFSPQSFTMYPLTPVLTPTPARITLAALGLLLALSVAGTPGQAADSKATDQADAHPLLIAGKHTLYQRVISRPKAHLYPQPDSSQAGVALPPFSILYVYQRREHQGEAWLQLGTSTHGDIRGWLPASESIDWNQALTLSFREPLGQDRTLLFRDKQQLKKLVASDDLRAYHQLYRQASSAQVAPDSPIVAIQPESYTDIQDNFYLVPIQQYEDAFMGGEKARLLKVSTVPVREQHSTTSETSAPKATAATADAGNGSEKTGDFRSGVVFVVDSTASMGPYIERTRQAVKRIYDSIQQARLNEKVSFGLVAYRDNVNAVPGLHYLTRTYASLKDGLSPAGFFKQVNAVAPSTASSRGFVEDTYAGIKKAIETIDWRPYTARTIVVVTDAGPRSGNDPLSATGLDAAGLRQLAQDRGIAIWVLHLKTPAGRRDHARAERLYTAVSEYPGIGDFYYGVDLGDVGQFGRVLETLAGQLTRQVRETAQGTPPLPLPDSDSQPKTQLAKLQNKVEKLGYALRMRYLQRNKNEPIPEVFNAWLVDRDFQNPERHTLDVRVLLTRDQLSDLRDVLQRVLETAEEGVLTPKNFLNDLKSLAASVSRDPNATAGSTRATAASGSNLADLGYMREYIDDLPYTGEVMNVSLSDWEEWSAKRQLKFLNRLEAKIRYYQALHDHTDLWISLNGGAIDGDSVFPIVLQQLP